MHFSPANLNGEHLYRGKFGGPITKWGQNVAILTISLYGGPSDGPVVKWGQNMAISRIRLYGRPFGGPVVKWGQNCGNLNNQREPVTK